MKTFFISSFVGITLLASGCFWAQNVDNPYLTDDFAVFEDGMYTLYPRLLFLQEKLDEATAFFHLGDMERSLVQSINLLAMIREMKNDSPAPYVCSHLDSLEILTVELQERIIREDDIRDWRSHMTSVLDSIGKNHVVEEEIEIVFNWRTDYWIKYFKGKGRKHFIKWLERAEIYRGIIEPILIKNEIPRDLLFLAVIESGLNLNAKSSVSATGPWQFMAGTGRIFNLRINWWIDERKDIVASTHAAAHYLKHLHHLFGNWQLALAGYNSGEYRVARAISTQKTDNYWHLRLPTQTRWFVPKFMAALAIGRDPEKYGFKIPVARPLHFDMIRIDRSTDLKLIASAAGCTLAKIKKLNPALKRWATPPGMVVEIKVPEGTGDKVLDAVNLIPPGERVSWLRHRIKKGETLSCIAEKYEISLAELKRINGIRNVHRIRVGKFLVIPTRDDNLALTKITNPGYRTPPKLPGKIKIKKYQLPKGKKKIIYTVRDRDTLSEIAENFHVGLSKLRSWNNLRYRSLIRPGDNLVVYVNPDSGYKQYTGDSISPAGEKTEKKQLIHVVKRGETLSAIGRMYKTRISDILAWNNSVKKDHLFPGDRITIWLDVD